MFESVTNVLTHVIIAYPSSWVDIRSVSSVHPDSSSAQTGYTLKQAAAGLYREREDVIASPLLSASSAHPHTSSPFGANAAVSRRDLFPLRAILIVGLCLHSYHGIESRIQYRSKPPVDMPNDRWKCVSSFKRCSLRTKIWEVPTDIGTKCKCKAGPFSDKTRHCRGCLAERCGDCILVPSR